MCAETFNDTARGDEADDDEAGSAETFAQSLTPDIAEAAGVNQSQLVNVSARENPDDGMRPRDIVTCWSLSRPEQNLQMC